MARVIAMRVLKVEMEGITTSFRYPYFMWGRHPTYLMPPPATIYGHICSALGEWVDPHGLEFGYIFTHEGKSTDLEHCHALYAAKPHASFESNGKKAHTNLEGNINPLKREFFFHPRLILYLNRPDWRDYFRTPRYPVVLGRSQDLATYTRISIINLENHKEAYYENTLLPWAWRIRTGDGLTLNMPRCIDYNNHREPHFDRFIALQERTLSFSEKWMHFDSDPLNHWTDPEMPKRNGFNRGVAFHSFINQEGSN